MFSFYTNIVFSKLFFVLCLSSIYFPLLSLSLFFYYRFILLYIVIYIYLCRLAWVDQKRRQVLYQRYIRATQVLYQLPIKTSGENRQMKQLGIFAAVTIE